jgi:hypothetical protein
MRGDGRCLIEIQEESICRTIIDKRPEQRKMDFFLWSRAAVGQLIEQEYGAHPQRGQIPCSLGLHPTKADQARLHHSRIVKAWVAIERPD